MFNTKEKLEGIRIQVCPVGEPIPVVLGKHSKSTDTWGFHDHACEPNCNAGQKSVFAEAIESAMTRKDFEVTLSVRLSADNPGEAIRLAVEDFHELTVRNVTIKDVKEV
jgi:hypothetical protein